MTKPLPVSEGWYEFMVQPVFGKAEGIPDLVLALDCEYALRKARVMWPWADQWLVLGVVDSSNRECIIPGSPTAVQTLVTKVSGE